MMIKHTYCRNRSLDTYPNDLSMSPNFPPYMFLFFLFFQVKSISESPRSIEHKCSLLPMEQKQKSVKLIADYTTSND
jgi:hypothetical protein